MKEEVQLMEKIHLLGVAPYEGMSHLLNNLAAQRDDVEMTVLTGNLAEGVETVRRMAGRPIDAIISRGGTSEIIRKAFDIPVYDVTPSAYDILRTIRLAQEMGEPFAIVGYPTITRRAGTLCEIIQCQSDIHTIHSEEECENVLRQLREKGIRIVVGDTISVRSCKDFNLHGLLIISGMESVEETVDSVIETHRHYRAVAHRASLLAGALSAGPDAALIFSSDGQEVFRSASGVSDELAALLGERIDQVITHRTVKFTQRAEGRLYMIRGNCLVLDAKEYCSYTISPRPTAATTIDKHQIRFISHDSDLPGSHPLDFYIGSGDYAQQLRSTCDRYASIGTPVLLIGPPGTGKGRIAHYIYSQSDLRHSSLIWIDACDLSEKGWDFLLNSEESPLLDSGLTVFFRDLNRIDASHTHALLTYLRSTGASRRNKFLFSFDSEDPNSTAGELYHFLTDELHSVQLHTLPVSQRSQDIKALVGLCINTFNIQFGTQLIGLTQEAILVIQNHPWPRNIDQIVQFIQKLVAGSHSSYISRDEVLHLLSVDKKVSLSMASNSIDLSRSLNEINREIVRRVYLAEEMNQTRTAERLGISRSTVWRMLKE